MPVRITPKLIFIYSICTAAMVAATEIDTLGITPFQVLGDTAQSDILSYGLPDAIANDLAKIPDLILVERTRLSLVLQELQLEQAGLVCEKDASHFGKLAGATIMLMGTVHNSKRHVRVFMRAVRVASGEIMFSVKAEQHIKYFSDVFKLEDLLARKTAVQLGLCMVQDHYEAANDIPTDSEFLFRCYSTGLRHLDSGEYTKALENFGKSAVTDQNFSWPNRIRSHAQKAFEELEKNSTVRLS